MNDNIEISDYTHDDFDELFALLNSVVAEKIYLGTEEPFQRQKCYDYRCILIAEDCVQVVAKLDGKVIGWCDTRLENGKLGLGMGVHKDYRSQGIGQLLLRALIDRVTTSGHDELHLSAWEDNASAIEFYKKIGFRRVRGGKTMREFAGRSRCLITMSISLK